MITDGGLPFYTNVTELKIKGIYEFERKLVEVFIQWYNIDCSYMSLDIEERCINTTFARKMLKLRTNGYWYTHWAL